MLATTSTRASLLHIPLVLMLMALLVTPAVAQQTPQEASLASRGVQRERNYFSPEPFEHYDTASGNVALTFVDLSLPGNAGRKLEFQRTYNNKGSSIAGDTSRWSFGFPGIVMRIIEQTVPANFTFDDSHPELALSTTPILVMGDGSTRQTLYLSRPTASTAANALVVSADFYKYDRQAHSLRMPDGTVCAYDAQTGKLTSLTDPFGNLVTLAWTTTAIVVTQYLGNAQSREITWTLDASAHVNGLQYAGRQWAYEYGHQSGAVSDITDVTLPNGSHWTFDYNSIDLTALTTPLGGRVDYTYDEVELWIDSQNSVSQHYLRYRDSSGRGVQGGHWQILWTSDPVYFVSTARITTPSGVVAEYIHDVLTGNVRAILNNFGVKEVSVYSGGQLKQHETFVFQVVSTISYTSPSQWWGTPELSQKTLNRDGRDYLTTVTYSASNFGDYHRAKQITETGHLTRTTTRTYSHNTSAWVLGLLTREDVAVGTETFRRDWTYNSTTGFVESERAAYRVGSSDPQITIKYGVDAQGNVAYRWPATLAQPTYFAYDWGRLSVTETPAYTDWATVNPDGTLADETVGGRTTSYQYDQLFRQTLAQPPGNTHPVITEFDDVAGTTKVSRGNSFTTTTLDGFGRSIGAVNSAGVKTTTGYDAEGRLSYSGYPFDDTHPDLGATITYDALDRPVQKTNPDTSFRHWTYYDGQVIVRDENGIETTQHVQAFGHPADTRLSGVTDALGNVWSYSYDAAGHIRSVAGPNSITRTWTYNGNGLLSQESHPESGATAYAYDSTMPYLLKQKTDAKNVVTTYTYDANGRLIGAVGGGKSAYFTYEYGSDNRQSASNDDVQNVFWYDDGGRMVQRDDVIAGNVFQTKYEYDLDDNLVAISYPSRAGERRRVSYEVGAEKRLARVFETAAGRDYGFGFTYHPSGGLLSYTAGNLLPTTVDYDPQRYWIRSIDSASLHLAYTEYDLVGNLRQITDDRPGMGQMFGYDALNRLASAIGPYGTANYPHDAYGNRTTAQGGPTIAYYPGTLRLSQQGNDTFSYDNNGNLTTAPGRTFTYTPRNMLETVTAGAAVTRYGYDGDLWRISKVDQTGTTYYFRGLSGELLTEWTNPTGEGDTRDYVYAESRLIAAVKRHVAASNGGGCGPLGSMGPLTIAPNGVGTVPFCGVSGQTVSTAITLTSGSSFGGLWYLTIKGPTGAAIGTTWGSSGTVLFLNTVTLPANGTYTVEIDPTGTLSGTVDVTVFDVHHFGGSIAADGSLVTVPINTPGQNGKLTFSGVAGQTVSASMRLASGSGYALTWYLNIKSASGTTLRTAWVPTGTLIFAEAVTLPSTGDYYVEVDPTAMALGTVAVSLYSATVVPGSIGSDGTPVEAQLNAPGQIARFSFNATAGQMFSAMIKSISQPTFNALWTLTIRKPDGTSLGSVSDLNGPQVFLNVVTATVSGTYTLEVDPSEMTIGTVEARLFAVSHLSGSMSVNGAAIPMSVITPGQNAVISFSGAAGQTVRVHATNNAIVSTYVYLRKPDGTTMTSTLSGSASFDLSSQTLPSAGTYSVLVDPVGSAVGGITISVTSP